MSYYWTFFLSILLAFAAPCCAGSVSAEIPVTQVVLFTSGVGNFVHTGTVDGDAQARLHFSAAQMNDVLKSMVITDLDGGTVGGITYPSQDPLAKTLQSFAVNLSGNPSLFNLLQQLRGSQIRIEAPETLAGKILSVESRQRKVSSGAETTTFTEQVLNLDTVGGIVSVPFDTITRIRLTDEALNRELQQALDTLAQAVDRQRKTLAVRFLGKGPRRVRIGYILETPVWKTSYRLDLQQDRFFLQGWAIVENTSDNDWRQVKLVLVSGRPVSFVQDLYTPRYLQRPIVEPPGYAPLKPKQYSQGVAPAAAPARSMPKEAASVGDKMIPNKALMGRTFEETDQEMTDIQRGVMAAAAADKAGELFKFTVSQPVDLARRQSAMFPIVNTAVKGEKVSIYNRAALKNHPMNGIWLHNDIGVGLSPGPVTVYDGGTYAGDALLGSLSPGNRQLLSYAADLKVLVDSSEKSDQHLTAVKILDGVLHETRLTAWTRTYRMENSAATERQIIIEHPFSPQRTLVIPDSYAEKTDRFYRFQIPLGPGKQESFKVREERVRLHRIGLMDMPVEQLVYYAGSGKISPDMKAVLETLETMKRELEVLKAERRRLAEQSETISRDQDRIRKNIRSVGPASQLGKRYLEKLNNQENRLDQTQKRLDELDRQIDQKQTGLSDYIAKLSVQ